MENYLSEAFDHEQFVADEISPLINKVQELCKEKGIPFVAGLVASSDGEGSFMVVRSAILSGLQNRTPFNICGALECLKNEELAYRTLMIDFMTKGNEPVH